MRIRVTESRVYDREQLPDYSWEKYQRGFQGILNNAYNQSCNGPSPKLGQMSEIERRFREQGGGSWQDFVRYYVRHEDGHDRVHEAIESMVENLRARVESIGADGDLSEMRRWSRQYCWSMLANTYRGFCSERTAIEIVADELGVPYTTWTTETDEMCGIDGYIGGESAGTYAWTVQVKPVTHLGLDLNDFVADIVIRYEHTDEEFVFEVPDRVVP